MQREPAWSLLRRCRQCLVLRNKDVCFLLVSNVAENEYFRIFRRTNNHMQLASKASKIITFPWQKKSAVTSSEMWKLQDFKTLLVPCQSYEFVRLAVTGLRPPDIALKIFLSFPRCWKELFNLLGSFLSSSLSNYAFCFRNLSHVLPMNPNVKVNWLRSCVTGCYKLQWWIAS